ncbi:beta-lactamase domain protein [hydrothermal vent metagenome]|uniref:Beta-lactamase domain protein n=1 Tax=hydrothermal vent metagenome TaxID=652676 RepID=A0A1W1BPF6_9ZZZZ
MQVYDYPTYTLTAIPHLGALENTIHLIFDKKTKKCCVIDPAWESDLFIKIATENGYTITDIWLTHWHPDHVNGVDELVNKTNAKVFIGINDKPYLKIKTNVHTLNKETTISIGNTVAKIIQTPGHTAGGISFLLENNFIVGDTLFVYGAGHCILPGGNSKLFFHTMRHIVNTIPNQVLLHCGHDYGTTWTTDMAEQKKHNPFLLIEDENDFIRYSDDIHGQTREYPMAPMTKAETLALL